MPPIRILVADDDAEVLSALVDVLQSTDRLVVVGTATSAAEVCRLAEDLNPDLVLLDVRMPGGGAAATASLHRLPLPPVVVAVSALTDVATVADLVRAGAVGYLEKGRIGSTLPELVVRCADGEVVLAVSTAAKALRTAIGPIESP